MSPSPDFMRPRLTQAAEENVAVKMVFVRLGGNSLVLEVQTLCTQCDVGRRVRKSTEYRGRPVLVFFFCFRFYLEDALMYCLIHRLGACL